MTTWEKLILKVNQLSTDVRYEELSKLLMAHGYEERSSGTGGSHHTFRKPGKAPITIPKNHPIKKTYIKLVKKAIESEEQV